VLVTGVADEQVDVPAGTVSQTTLGEKGFQVTVSRTVTDANGKLVHQDSFASHYIPEDAIYLIGKGGKLPAGQTLSGLYPGYTGSAAGINLATWLGKPAKKKKPAGATIPPNGTIPGVNGTGTPPGGTTTGTTGTTAGTPTGTTPTGTTTTPAG